jgi:hypothetical protein
MQETNWKSSALELAQTGTLSWREIAEQLKVPKSTVSDFLRRTSRTPQESKAPEGRTHLYIPDSQVKPGVSLDYLEWIGKYIVRKRPDVIVHAGDFADMESLSSYDKGKRTAEGKRVQLDIDAAREGWKRLNEPIVQLQREQFLAGEPVYMPRKLVTLGNHEDRITRHVNANPELHGFLSIDSLGLDEYGWEVHDFKKPVVVDGIAYVHYWENVMTGRPLSGTAANMLKTIGQSFTMGHRQTLDIAVRFLPTGQQQIGLVCGACYEHQESYKGHQGNHHWKGVVLKHNVKDGAYDPLFVSLDWLKRTYG